MSLETIFSITNTIAFLAWLLLIVAPRSLLTRKLVLSNAVALVLAVVYLILVIVFWGTAEGDFFTLAGIGKLFSSPQVLLAAWVHYLVFDLFVGAWEVRDAEEKGVSHWFVVPCLLLTFIFGPIGFLMYYIVRQLTAKGDKK